jgi:predicted acetyltransferase
MQAQPDFEYGPIAAEEAEPLAALLSQSLHFNLTADGITEWIGRVGHEPMRAVRQAGKMVTGLRIIEMGQWFGGVRIPIVAISAVGAAPEHRGQGATTYLMQKMHEEVRERGYAISTLYPATLSFYRRTGYERAGAWNKYEIETARIYAKDRALEMVAAGEEEYGRIRRLYDCRAQITNGHLDRSELLWQRTLEPKEKTAHKYLIRQGGEEVGYVVYVQGGQHESIRITDYCALTPEAVSRVLTFFSDHRSLATTIIWNSGPNDPLLYALAEQDVKVPLRLDWVLRVVDVEKALMQRGYPAGLNTEVHFDVRDDQLLWNDGRFLLRLEEGRPTVVRGGEGRLRLDARTLATLYTGYLSPLDLKVAGRLEGSAPDLASAQIAFSGPRPWMPDIF